MSKPSWFEVKAKAAGTKAVDVYIYDQIGKDWWTGDGVAAKDFVDAWNAIDAEQINLHVNSPGGSVFDGLTIYNTILRDRAKVTAHIDGLAASIASVIVLAAGKINMADNALFMIHNPSSIAIGDAAAMRKTADMLDKTKGSLVTAYQNKTNRDAADIGAKMDAETWFTAAEAKDYGLIDNVTTPDQALAASVKPFDLKALGFRNAPQAVAVPVEDKSNKSDKGTEAITPPPPPVADVKPHTAPKAGKTEVQIMDNDNKAPDGAEKRNGDVAEIIALCDVHKVPTAKMQEFVKNNLSVDQVSREILKINAAKAIATPGSETVVDELPAKDAKRYSYVRAALVSLGDEKGGLEQELHDEIAKKLPLNYQGKNGIFVPTRLNPRNAAADTKTGDLQPAIGHTMGELIDLLRNQARVIESGAQVLSGLTGPVVFPKQTAAASVSWVKENPGSDISTSKPSLGTVTLTPKTVMGAVQYSRQLLRVASIDVERMFRNDVAIGHSLAIDLAAIHGTGTDNEPQGVYQAPGVNSASMGGVPTYGKFVDMATAIANLNALMGTLAFLTTPGMAGKMMQTLEASAAGAGWIWKGNHVGGTVAGYTARATNQISALMSGSAKTGGSEHGIVYGDWAQMVLGLWGAMELIPDEVTLKKQGLIEFATFQMADIVLKRPESFTKSTGATIS